MWLIRGILGLVFIAIAVVFLPVALEQPLLIIPVIAFAALGLWTTGWVSIYSTKEALAKDDVAEQRARTSPWFSLRNRLMGLVAFLIGGCGLYWLIDEGSWASESEALFGCAFLASIGVWYLVKGKNAE